ncbi:stage III sporulation protein AG [Sporofaciens sp. SGI.106]|uniref:stage III sporulation protein AG n=1 Tax=Sporofaciens sp. SGI.106 TaxID=3420568 RepID=UPI003D086F68
MLADQLKKRIPSEILKKDRLVILLLCGVLLLIIALPVNTGNQNNTDEMAEKSAEAVDSYSYARYLEQHLEEILSQVKGAGEVRVMITLTDSGERIVEKDTESTTETVKEEDSQGGSRTTMNDSRSETSVYNSGSGESLSSGGEPYVTKEKTPVVGGIIVIADGGDNGVVVQNITEAIQALFDVDTHKIKVMKRS